MGSWYEQQQQKCIDQMNQDLYDSVWNAKPLNIWEQLKSINLKLFTMNEGKGNAANAEPTLSRIVGTVENLAATLQDTRNTLERILSNLNGGQKRGPREGDKDDEGKRSEPLHRIDYDVKFCFKEIDDINSMISQLDNYLGFE